MRTPAREREAYILQAVWLRQRHRRYPLARQMPTEAMCERSTSG